MYHMWCNLLIRVLVKLVNLPNLLLESLSLKLNQESLWTASNAGQLWYLKLVYIDHKEIHKLANRFNPNIKLLSSYVQCQNAKAQPIRNGNTGLKCIKQSRYPHTRLYKFIRLTLVLLLDINLCNKRPSRKDIVQSNVHSKTATIV